MDDYIIITNGTQTEKIHVTACMEDPTEIKAPKGSDDSDTRIYNMSGQRLGKMQKGINIIGGKKILK